MESTPEERLVVADSFRVREWHGTAEVRAFDAHLARFTDSALRAAGGPLTPLAGFLAHARERIARHGEGNPRLELWESPDGAHRLNLLERPLPELRTEIALRAAGRVELDHPERKGPNIQRLIALNASLGAEALLTDRTGAVTEGATTALLWWDGDTLCSAASAQRVRSVTEGVLVEAAAALGARHDTRSVTPAELARHELWAVNALHGLRPVTELDGTRMPDPDPERLAAFLAALDRSWQPVAAGVAA